MTKVRQIAVLDEQGKLTGALHADRTVHIRGLLHPMAHGWVLNTDRNAVLVRRRGGKTFTGMHDVTLATHIKPPIHEETGELVREIGLEAQALLAIQTSWSRVFGDHGPVIRFVGVTTSYLSAPDPYFSWMERSLNHTFVIESPNGWDITPSDREPGVDATFEWTPLDEVLQLIRTQNRELVPHGEEFVRATRAIMNGLIDERASHG